MREYDKHIGRRMARSLSKTLKSHARRRRPLSPPSAITWRTSASEGTKGGGILLTGPVGTGKDHLTPPLAARVVEQD